MARLSKLEEAHIAEALDKGAEFYNLGWASGRNFIHSKTDKGRLFTERTADGSFSHEWTGFCAACGIHVPLSEMPEGDICNKHRKNVASLDLCKELYELSGWDDASLWYSMSDPEKIIEKWEVGSGTRFLNSTPAYDLGFLMRKLPRDIEISRCSNGDWSFRSSGIAQVGAIPEDAVARLAIELHMQNILTKETKE